MRRGCSRLTRVEDATSNTQGFKDVSSAVGTQEYRYDKNGNMISDTNKGITAITYNYLNLPQQVTLNTGTIIHYTYDAAGLKHQKVVDDGSPDTTTYIGGFHYTNGDLKFLQHSEGRTLKSASNWTYEYNLTDHLGNVRVSVDESGNVVQRDGYYPFGGVFNSWHVSPKNHYMYQGKEEQQELDTYDFHARMYDPMIGRTFQIDPMADKYYFFSPYSWVANNPLMFTDPTGMEIDWSKISGKDKRVAKRALRKHKSSGTYKNLYKELKKSENRYVIRSERLEKSSHGARFDGNSSTTVDDPDGEPMVIQNGATDEDFAPDEKGGVIRFNFAVTDGLKTKDQVDLLGDFATEEVVHAAQYENNNKGTSEPKGLGGTAGVEFEAKAIVGQIQSESRRELLTTPTDASANSFGVKAFKTRNVKGYQNAMTNWHKNSSYRSRPNKNLAPKLLIRLINR